MIKNVIKPETETMNSIDDEIITKEHVNSLSKDKTNSIQKETLEDQDDLNGYKIMKIGEIKQSDTIGKLKYDNVYVLDSMGDKLQDKLLKIFWVMKKE